ncbi:hypothetical protein I6E85_11720 [Pseudoalteromonas sp. NZS71]|uniref:hypothetical protein n=1 Tax=unclassified Pseudoalteromonas TaxID=194690 RepID=UPI0004660AA7|nr:MULTISPECIES: hypothetical protein [unclassified Pseudoalteromonas]MBH0061826.1 hypothetical protein [Pseudoalteromonas sp. NZS71]
MSKTPLSPAASDNYMTCVDVEVINAKRKLTDVRNTRSRMRNKIIRLSTKSDALENFIAQYHPSLAIEFDKKDEAPNVDLEPKEKPIKYIEQILKDISHNAYAVGRYQRKLYKLMNDPDYLIWFIENHYGNVKHSKKSTSPH